MTSTASDTLKVSAGFDINAEFRSMMHGLGLSPENTRRHNHLRRRRPDLPKCASARRVHQYPDHSRSGGDRRHLASAHRPRPGPHAGPTQGHPRHQPDVQSMPTINGYPYQAPYGLNPSYRIANPRIFDFCRTRDGRFFLPTGPTRACSALWPTS